MKISEVILGSGIEGQGLNADVLEAQISGVSCDSRTTKTGDLFFAVDPTFAHPAIEKGAVAVVAKEGVEVPSVPEEKILRSGDIRRAMALSAANFFGRPAQKMTLFGITGTNGKTTTSLLVESMLQCGGEQVGFIGTIGYSYGGRDIPAPNTTPGSIPLQKLLSEMCREGVTSVVMEVSSHALDQKRADGIPFASAAFTNLTRDHLDYHGDMATYFQAKRRLFTELCAGVCTLNVDDPHGQKLHSELIREGRVAFSFSSHSQEADLFVTDLVQDVNGLSATLHTPSGNAHFHSPLVGLHNVENILAAAGLVLGAGFELSDVIDGIESLQRVPGRLDRVPSTTPNAPAVFVDYAHTDDALSHVLVALRPLTQGRLICVFGCGGDRDHGKRPLMGNAVAQGADLALITNDNPRSELPEAIAQAVTQGVIQGGMTVVDEENWGVGNKECAVVLSREAAISRAIHLATSRDIVLIAGKGHENYQLIGGQKLNFDDRAQAMEALATWKCDHSKGTQP